MTIGTTTDGRLVVLRATGFRSTFIVTEIHTSARRHGVADEDMKHAYDNAMRWVQLGDDPVRYLLAGPDRAGNLVELVALQGDVDVVVIHAMRLRSSTKRELFGGTS